MTKLKTHNYLKLLICLFFITTFDSCEVNNTNKDNLINGNWFYIDRSDSSYNELYFNLELFFYNSSQTGISRVYHYVIRNDSILIVNGTKLLFKVENIKDTVALVTREDGEIIHLEKLTLKESPFKVLIIPDEERIRIQKGRIFRGTKTLIKRGLFKDVEDEMNMDSIIYIPVPEN